MPSALPTTSRVSRILRRLSLRSASTLEEPAVNRHLRGRKSQVRTKIRLVFGIALTSLIAVLYAASSTILLNGLRKAEEHDVRQGVKGVLNIFAQTEEQFNANFVGWAVWDDTYKFIETRNQAYIESNLQPKGLALSNIDLILYIHPSGRIVYGSGIDGKNKRNRPLPQSIQEHLSRNDLLQHLTTDSRLTGVLLLQEGTMLINSQPILTSKGEGPIRGTQIIGRYLEADELANWSRIAALPLTVYRVNDPLPRDIQAVRSSLSGKTILVRPVSEQTIAGYTLLNDIYGQPALLLRVELPREIYHQGQYSLRYLFASLIVVGVVFSRVTLPLLERSLRFQYEHQEREERYRAVVAQASEGIFLLDAQTKGFLEVNAAFVKLLGYTADEILKLTLYDVVVGDRQNLGSLLQLQTQKDFIGEWQYATKTGVLIDVEVSANPISYQEQDAFCVVVRDITERKRAEEALRESEKRLSWQASHDSLTGLFNRREFEQRVEKAVFSARTSDQQHVLCYLDLDQFKIVNDTSGHGAGDALLRQVSTLFQSRLRKTDVLARLGGDEFGILLYQCPLEQALQIANALREQIDQFRFVWQDKTFSISVSIGLVTIDADTQSKNSVLSAADVACYAAKNRGRNRLHIYQLNDAELALARGEMQWVSKIPKALEDNRFRLYYQTIVPLESSKTEEHWEVLLRLEDEIGQLVSPMAFIPAAERYSLMHLIDRWVISTLFAHLGQQHSTAGDYSSVPSCPSMYCVNLSGDSINDDRFACFVQEQFTLHKVPPRLICFEITETVAIAHLGKAAQFMDELRALGCHFALDDFGSGMSSFGYLKNLPVDYLKIDGVFIKDIVTDAIASEMVEAIGRIASVMGIQTVAEFVENQAIATKLKTLGIDYVQGYAITKPRLLAIANQPTASLLLEDCL